MCRTIRSRRCGVILFLQVAIASALAVSVQAQARHDSFRGRVTTDSGVAIATADVIVTLAPTAESFRTTTDSSGRFALSLTNGTGEYVFYVGATGWKPFRRRLAATGRDTTFTLEVSLASSVQLMTQVAVRAATPRPSRPSALSDGSPGTGMDRSTQTVLGALPPDMATNVDALASTIPGLSTSDGGFSAFGLGAAGNGATLNGLSVSAADLPREVGRGLRFLTSPWDPSIGGFAGALAALSLARGGNVSSSSGHLRLDHPALQFSDAIAERAGRRFLDIALSQGGSGAVDLDALYYNYGVQVSRRSVSTASLLTAEANLLSNSGVSADSAARLLQIVKSQHIPLSRPGIPSERITTTVSFAGQLDHVVPIIPASSVPLASWSLTGIGAYSQSEALGLTATATAGTAGMSSNANAVLQAKYVTFIGDRGTVVSQTNTGVNVTRRTYSPYLKLPSAIVLINSTLPDGSSALGTLTFGGNGAADSRTTSWGWETTQLVEWLYGGIPNRPLRWYFQSKLEGFAQETASSGFGSFSYPSLAALAANTPSGFNRILSLPSTSGGEWTGSASFGGNWTLGKWRITGGARVDANVFTAAPAINSTVSSAFGVPTGVAPNTFGVSPRLGFSRELSGGPSTTVYVSPLAQILQSSGTVRGGIGLFRSTLPSDLLAGAMASNGLPGGAHRMNCVGSAVPSPDWQSYAIDQNQIPTSCIGTTAFADTIPNVSIFDPSYRPVQSWRATMGYTRTIVNTYVTIDAIVAQNMYQSGVVDLNFTGTPRFALGDEVQRPVYVDPSSISTVSGLATLGDSRRVAAIGRVMSRRSDLAGSARQITISAVPNIPFKLGQVTLGYSWQNVRTEARGFDFSTAGDPRARESMVAPFAPTHTVVLQYAKNFGESWGFTTFLRSASGVAYTPLVGGDVNGDGAANDRAFVFDPARVGDPALATSMRSLLTETPASARECLISQLGAIARPNSCTGPWTTTMNAAIYVLSPLPGTAGRGRLTLSLVNVPGAVDLLLHGPSDLRGWGAASFPDQTLLRVRGFDPAAQRFLYDVNPRFGSVSAATTTVRVPFRIALDYSMQLGANAQAQQLELNLRLRAPLKGTRAPADSIAKRYLQDGFGNFYGYLMQRLADSLALSSDQLRKMQSRSDDLNQRGRAIYLRLGEYLAGLPADYDPKVVLARIKDAESDAWTQVDLEREFMKQLMNPAQVRRLPARMFQWMTDPTFKGRFYYGGF